MRKIFNAILSEKEIEDFEDKRADDNGAAEAAKQCLTLSAMDVYKVEDKYYFISGEDSIFLLNYNGEYSKKLRRERTIMELGLRQRKNQLKKM